MTMTTRPFMADELVDAVGNWLCQFPSGVLIADVGARGSALRKAQGEPAVTDADADELALAMCNGGIAVVDARGFIRPTDAHTPPPIDAPLLKVERDALNAVREKLIAERARSVSAASVGPPVVDAGRVRTAVLEHLRRRGLLELEDGAVRLAARVRDAAAS